MCVRVFSESVMMKHSLDFVFDSKSSICITDMMETFQMYFAGLKKSVLKFSIGLGMELVSASFFKTWNSSGQSGGRLAAKRARRRKKARSTCFQEAYSRSDEITGSVLSETLDYIRRLILGTAYEKREVVRREQQLCSGLPAEQLELR